MARYLILICMAVLLCIACDSLSTDPGSFVVVFQWETGHEPDTAAKEYYIWAYYQEWKGGEGKEFPADIETNAKSLDEAGPVQLGSGESLNFTKLTYGSNRFVRAAVWDNAERTGDPLYIGVSELFNFSADDRNKQVAVNMKLQANAGVDETGEAGSFAVEVRYDGVAADRVPAATVTLRFTVKNADTVIIANDLNFEKGPATLKLTDLTQIDDTTYEYGPWDITTGWEGLGDTTYSVFGKSRNKLGYESDPQRADVYLDTTAPVPNITPFPEVAKLGDTITVRFSFDEEVLPEALELNWRWLEFTLVENKADKSYIFAHTVTADDPESTADFTLRATDAVGNATDHLPLGSVTIDRTAPQTGAMTVTKNGVEVMPSSNLYLKDGDELALSVAFSEELGTDPLIRLGMHELACVAGDENAYDCSLTIDKDIHGDTIADLSASLVDRAGNTAVATLKSYVRIDSQPPQITFQKNKQTDYNATEQIVYTLTTNEALATLTVDGVAQTVDSVSWTFTGQNTTGDHQITVTATDLAGNEHPAAAIGTYRVDATYPTATIGTPSADRINATGTVTVTVNEPSEPIANAKINGEVCAGTLGNYTCTYDAPTGTGDEVQTLTVTFDDAVGNTTVVAAGTVYVDRTNPEVSGDAAVVVFKPAGCPLSSVTAVTAGGSIDVSFTVTEIVAGIPSVRAVRDTDIITFALNGQTGYFYTYRADTIDTSALTDGRYTLEITLDDEAGNENTITFPSTGFDLLTAGPATPAVGITDTIIYRRIPWGNAESGGIKYFGIRGGADAVDQNAAFIYAYDGPDPATASEIGKTTVANRTFAEFELNRADRTEVYLAAYDNACNRSNAVKVRDVEWIATMGYKQQGDTFTNPHTFFASGVFDSSLDQDPLYMQELPIAGQMSFVQTGKQKDWQERAQSGQRPSVRDNHALAYDSARGTVLLFGGGIGYSPTDETWEWDGTTWTQRYPAIKPVGRRNHAMAYDSARGRIVLFGGSTGAPSAYNDETWEWDGALWTRMDPAHKPSARYAHAMAYDSVRGTTVLFGGQTGTPSDETWEWNGTDWTRRDPAHTPSARQGHAMAYDSVRGAMILFGGQTGSFNDETWAWDGADWTPLSPATKPSGRQGHAMVYDGIRDKIVLFGGYGGAYNDETWEWDGADWTQMVPTNKPSGRYWHAMAYNSARGTTVLFGGFTGAYDDETWEWDGTSWRRLTLVTGPSPRGDDTMTYDRDRDRVVLFGGSYYDSSTHYFDDTWEWDGAEWTQMNPMDKPSARKGYAMTYDDAHDRVVLFGGNTGTDIYSDETWEWDGIDWTQKTPVNKPSARHGHAMAYDGARGKAVLFGGSAGTGIYSDETWEWDGTDWTQMNPADKPSARYWHAMVYDDARNTVLLFGGQTGEYSDETWEWDGVNWTRMSPANKPSARQGHAMIYDSVRDTVVLFGGIALGLIDNETWAWNGTNWALLTPANKPAGRSRHAMAFHSARGTAFLFGGSTGSYSDETWEFDGGGALRPAQFMKIVFSAGGVTPPEVLLRSISSFFAAGGTGYTGPDCDAVHGAKMLVWNTAYRAGAWWEVDANTAGTADPDMLEFTTSDQDLMKQLFFGNEWAINIAVSPLSPNGCSADMGSVSVDYAEVIVRYSIAD